MRKLVIILLITVLFYSCSSTKIEMPSVQGMIYDGSNEAVCDVEVLLNGQKQTVSDIYGHFALVGLRPETEYTLLLKKLGFEETVLKFSYLNPSQVIYARMYSTSELLALAERETKDKKYDSALIFLERAEKIGENYLSVNYLKSVVFFLKKDYETSLKIAQEIVENGYIDSYVYVLLADIYEIGMNDQEKANGYLKKALDISFDPNIQKRLEK